MANQNYEPFSQQWQKEMHQLPKKAIIEMFAEVGKEKIELEQKLKIDKPE